MRQPFLRILRWFPTLSRSFGCLRCGSRTRCCAGLFSGFPAFVVAVEADDAALSADFPARWHWLRPARHLLTRHWQIMRRCFLSLPQLRRSVPLPFQKPGVRLGRFCHLRRICCRRCREAALLALEAAFVSDDFAASLRPTHPVLKWLLLTLSWSRWCRSGG